MGSKAQGKASSENAKRMREAGIYHGKRLSKPMHNNMPVDAPGSAAYRRLTAKKRGRGA